MSTSTREALVAAVAAAEDDDLPRLVLADWFEENGEPERAEFIRLSVTGHTDPSSVDQARLGDLFEAHAARWFAPCLTAIDPTTDPTRAFDFRWVVRWGRIERPQRRPQPRPLVPPPTFLDAATVRRGFLQGVEVNAAHRPAGSTLTAGMRHEPLELLHAVVTPEPRCWERFTHPALLRFRKVTLAERTGRPTAVGIRPAFHDPNLGNATEVMIGLLSPNGNFGIHPPPADLFADFGGSPLGMRCERFTVCAGDDELPTLARQRMPALTELAVHGLLTAAGVRTLLAAPFAPRLRTLRVATFLLDHPDFFTPLGDAARLTRLTDLDLGDSPVGNAALAAFAAGRLIRQLERLDLSECSGLTPAGVRAVVDGLDADRLKELRLPLEVTLPMEVRVRFGERVKAG